MGDKTEQWDVSLRNWAAGSKGCYIVAIFPLANKHATHAQRLEVSHYCLPRIRGAGVKAGSKRQCGIIRCLKLRLVSLDITNMPCLFLQPLTMIDMCSVNDHIACGEPVWGLAFYLSTYVRPLWLPLERVASYP